MKTAKEWANYRPIMCNSDLAELIETVQRDALEAAAKACEKRSVRMRYPSGYQDGFCDGCDTCSDEVRALIPPTTDRSAT